MVADRRVQAAELTEDRVGLGGQPARLGEVAGVGPQQGQRAQRHGRRDLVVAHALERSPRTRGSPPRRGAGRTRRLRPTIRGPPPPRAPRRRGGREPAARRQATSAAAYWVSAHSIQARRRHARHSPRSSVEQRAGRGLRPRAAPPRSPRPGRRGGARTRARPRPGPARAGRPPRGRPTPPARARRRRAGPPRRARRRTPAAAPSSSGSQRRRRARADRRRRQRRPAAGPPGRRRQGVRRPPRRALSPGSRPSSVRYAPRPLEVEADDLVLRVRRGLQPLGEPLVQLARRRFGTAR